MTKHINLIAGALLAALAIAACTLLLARPAHALITTSLEPGSSGPAVIELQSFLARDSSVYPEGIISGYYGTLTTSAVERFQCQNEIVCSGSVATTGYGRVGPTTLARIQSLALQTPGIPNTGGTSDVIAPDARAPYISPETVTVSSTTALIHWTTSESSLNSVLYASEWPFYLGTAASESSGIGMNANVVLSGLLPNHTYRYVRQSVDMAGNVQYGFGGSFTTTK